MRKALLVTGLVLLAVLGAAAGAFWWVARPVPLEAFDEPGASLEARERHTLVVSLLDGVGIESALVDITAQRAYVAYDAPAGREGEAEDLQLAALLALALAEAPATEGIAVMYVDQAPALMWKGDLKALRAAGEDRNAVDAWLGTVEKTEL